MRTLIVGAGATGGYFGGRMLEAGRDVTFLVRPRRAAILAEKGLTIRSPQGDYHRAAPPTITADALREPFDLVLLSCKAYDLQSAIDSFAPAVGPQTMILTVLNGLAHLDVLDSRFGSEHVLGGHCFISTYLDPHDAIQHLGDLHVLFFGERDGSLTPRIEAVQSLMAGTRFESRLSRSILQEMWDKWVFIAAGASVTCLMRTNIGDIVSAGGAEIASSLLDECNAIARAEGYEPSRELTERSRSRLTAEGSDFTASMFRDIERRAPIEADHLVGDMLRRGREHGIATPLLRIAYTHLKSYEARRAREQATSS